MTEKFAIVAGTGFGCRVHVPALRAAGFEVVALVGTRPDKLERKAAESGVPAFFTDLDEAIEKTGAKAVTIATTPATHAQLALKAIDHSCHVVCEKPFAFNAVEGAALLAAAQKAGIVHMVAHEFRWLPERALDGRLPRVSSVIRVFWRWINSFLSARIPKWCFDKQAGGGWLGACGSHLLDQIRAWFGDFQSVSANLMVVSDRSDVADDSYSLRFQMRSGLEGSMQQSAGARGPPTTLWRCAGSKGSVWIDSGKVIIADKTGTRELPVPEELQLPPQPPAADPNSPNRLSHFELGPFTRLCQALRDAIDGRDARSPVAIPTFRDGLASMQVIDAIHASSAAGGALQIL